MLPTDVDVDAGIQWLPDSAFVPPREANTFLPSSRGDHPGTSGTTAPQRQQKSETTLKAGASSSFAADDAALVRPRAKSTFGLSEATKDDLTTNDVVTSPQRSGDGVSITDEHNAADTGVEEAGSPSSPGDESAVHFFGSGEWAAGGVPGTQAVEPSPIVDVASGVGGATAPATWSSVTTAAVAAAALEPPGSPLSVRSARVSSVGAEPNGGSSTGHWGGEDMGGILGEESPSRGRERAARRALMQEAGDSGEFNATMLFARVRTHLAHGM